MFRNPRFYVIAFFSCLLFACASQVELTTSWANKTATVKKSPKIMVMAFGKVLANRQAAESYIVAELNKGGHNAIPSLDLFKPDVKHYDSLMMVNMLREAKVDLLLTNAIVDVRETQRYVPPSTETVEVGSYPINSYPVYSEGYYNYYNYRSTYYQPVYETRTTPGYTVTDIEVLIESNLYDVATTELLWVGQSKSYTKEPSSELFNSFAKIVVADITKNNLLQK